LHHAAHWGAAFVAYQVDMMESTEILTQLQDLQEQLRTAQRIAHIGSWTLHLRDEAITWSDETFRIFGVDPQRFQPTFEAFFALVLPDDRGRVLAEHEAILRGQRKIDFMYRFLRPDGEVRNVHCLGKAVIKDDGRLIFSGTVQDITERTENLEKLRRSESLLQIAGRIARMGGWEIDLHSRRVSWSDEVCAIHGVPPGTLVSVEDAIAFYAPQWRQHITQAFDACVRDGTPYDEEMQILTVHGKLVWVRTIGEAVRDADGRIVRVHGAFQDISDKKLAEEEKLRLDGQLGAILENITDAFFALDREWRFTYLNREAERLLARSRADLLGKNVWQEFREAVGSTFYSEYHKAIKDRCPVSFEEFYAPLGRWLEVKAYPTDEGLAVYFHDVTDRNRARTEIQETQERFKIVAKATSDVIWDWNLQENALWWNENITSLFGHALTELEPRSESWANLLHPEDRGRVLNGIYAAIDGTNEKWADEYRFMRKDGTYAYVLDRGFVIRNAEGAGMRMVGSMTDISARKLAESEIHKLAFYDALTRLPNRVLLQERLQRALQASMRTRSMGALLFIDLDNFKTLNDTFGHDKGDRLLQEIAERLKCCVRGCDTVARLGGDEFVILVEGLGGADAEAAANIKTVAQKVNEAFTSPCVLDGYPHYSTPSIGIALFDGTINTVEEVLKRADLAMYQSKAAGRNTIRFFDPAMQELIARRVALEAELRQALRQGEFVLHYQPQVDGSGRIIGAEALVRWQHPQRGLVYPGEFIALAEETGLILELGCWVMQAACLQLTQWSAHADKAQLSLAVNVSARQFRHPDFVDRMIAVLRQSGANPRRLKLELTESVLVDDLEGTSAKMRGLKAAGINFSLDDFGTGYSSLSYINRLPLDQLKIDRSFVKDVANDANADAIVRTILALGKALGLNVIAEGVETNAQHAFLAQEGCGAYQGYLFGRPVPLLQFEALQENRDSGPN